MRKSGSFRRLQATCFVIVLACSFFFPSWLAQAASKKARAEVDEFFKGTYIPQIEIQVPATALSKLRGRAWGWGGPNRDRPEVQVTVTEEGHTYTNVAMHMKGAAGSFQPIESKPGLTLNFDKFAKGQTFHGLTKLSLNNSVQDGSYLSEKISRELFAAAGVPVPRANFAVVSLNGRKLGFYVLLEGYNKQFLKRFYKDTSGNLYDGGFLRDIDVKLSTNSGDNPNDQSDLKGLVSATKELDRGERYAQLAKRLDVTEFVSFLAMEILACHWDGYAMNKNNYRVYHDRDSDRIVFMPHGMDQMFGVMMIDATLAVRPPMQGMVAKALMDTAEGRRRYFERLAELNKTVFDVERLTNRVQELATRIHPVIASISSSAEKNHQRDVAALVERIVQRKQSLDEQLTGAAGYTLTFDDSGLAHLSAWTSITNFGHPLFNRESTSTTNKTLHISASRGSSVGSWRTKVLLEDGHYVFQARMHTKDVTVDPRDTRAGAGLRVSGRSSSKKSIGNSEWTDVRFEFDLPDGIHDVELICELRASQGDVWFDEESLQLIRQ